MKLVAILLLPIYLPFHFVARLLARKHYDDQFGRYTEEDFCNRMRLNQIEVHADGSLEFCYSDGGLFLGHSLLVLVNADLSIHRVDVTG